MEEVLKIIEGYNQEKNIIQEKLCSEFNSTRSQYPAGKEHIELMKNRITEIDKILSGYIIKITKKD